MCEIWIDLKLFFNFIFSGVILRIGFSKAATVGCCAVPIGASFEIIWNTIPFIFLSLPARK